MIQKRFVVGFLSFLMDAYLEKERSDSSGNVDLRTVLHLHPQLAPVKVAVLPQIQQQSELCDVAHQLSSELREAGGLNSSRQLEIDKCWWRFGKG